MSRRLAPPWGRAVALAALLLAAQRALPAVPPYTEPYRPQYHFSPAKNWMNDPNGLVYFEGEYHLFYQYNPQGSTWGHMSWGHAVTTDLVHWQALPLALPEERNGMIFSGSAVVDWDNTSGFGEPGHPAMVAVYTGHQTHPQREFQSLAYSRDLGRTWTPYPGNPVIDRQLADFRDPKVFRYETGACWLMAVALPAQRKIAFYRSADLKRWDLLSEFGPAGATKGVWECPDLLRLSVRGESGVSKWVLVVNIDNGAPNGGTGVQYFVGEFDGTTFTPDRVAGAIPTSWADCGRDFYATGSWNGVPAGDRRHLWIGWMNNGQYNQVTPTSPWRGVQSLIREIDLVRSKDRLVLAQHPIAEYNQLRTPVLSEGNRLVSAGGMELPGSDCFELRLELTPRGAKRFGVSLLEGSGHRTRIGYDVSRQVLLFDRTLSGEPFSPQYPGIHEAPLPLDGQPLTLRIFVDRSVVEVFANDGRVVFSEQVFPARDGARLSLYCDGGAVLADQIDEWQMASIWPAQRR